MSDGAAHAVYTLARTKADITNDAALKPGRFGKPASGDGLAGTVAGGGSEDAVKR
jgi:hypothetical protein